MAHPVGEVAASLDTLERACDYCDGRGSTVSIRGDRFPCAECDGTGYVLTDVGERVFAFLQHSAQRIRARERSSR